MRSRSAAKKKVAREPSIEKKVRSVAAQEGLHLQQAVVSTGQHRLRLLNRINLSRAGILANLEVLQQEVARPMQARNVLTQGHQVRSRRGLILLRRSEVALKSGLLALLLGDRSAVGRTLRRALLHQLLVVLLRVSARSRRRRWRGDAVVRRRSDGCECDDTRASNARLSGCCLLRITRVSATRVYVDALFLRQLASLWRLVNRRVVELVQAVLCDAQQLHSRIVLRRHRHELLVLGLARLRSLRD